MARTREDQSNRSLRGAVQDLQTSLIRSRVETLGWTRSDLVRRLDNEGTFRGTKRDSRRRLVDTWLDKHPPGDPRQAGIFWRVLQDTEPQDWTLREQVDLIGGFVEVPSSRPPERRERERQKRYYALCLARALERGLAPQASVPESGTEPKGTAAVWKATVDLVTTALKSDEERPRPLTVLIDAPGFESTLIQRGLGAVADEWQHALRQALDRGWTVIHVLSRDGAARQVLPPAVQADLVLNLLYAATTPGHYQPVVHAPWDCTNVVAVEEHGAIGIWDKLGPKVRNVQKLWSELADAAAPSRRKRQASARVADGVIRHTQSMLPAARALPPVLFHRDDPYDQLRFDMALAAEEAEPQARHAMIKAGPPLVTLPDGLWDEHKRAWTAATPAELHPYVALHDKVFRMRQGTFMKVTQIEASSWRYRDIVTLQGIERYLSPHPARPDGGQGSLWGLAHLDVAARHKHIEHVAQLLRQQPGYELALVDEDALLVSAQPTWWAVVASDSPGVGAVFFVTDRRDGFHQGWLYDSESTNLVDGFMSLFQGLWDTLRPSARDRAAVADRLERLAAIVR